MIEVTHPDRKVRIIYIGGLSKMSLTEYPCAPTWDSRQAQDSINILGPFL